MQFYSKYITFSTSFIYEILCLKVCLYHHKMEKKLSLRNSVICIEYPEHKKMKILFWNKQYYLFTTIETGLKIKNGSSKLIN